MNNASLVCILIGVLVIAARGPLVFAPGRTIEVYRKLVASHARIRVMGIFIGGLGAACLAAGWGLENIAAYLVLGMGCLMTAGSIFLIVFAFLYKIVADAFFDAMDDLLLRLLGVFGVLFGALFIWLGTLAIN